MVVPSLVENEFFTEILLNDMDISWVMVYAKNLYKSKLWESNRDSKSTRVYEPSKPYT